MADVFISYARAERKEAETVKARLEAVGLSVFLDVDGLDGGDVFSEKLDREVKGAGIVLGLWSPHALARPWVQTECDIGKRRGVLIPVAIKPFRDMDVPAPFWNIQFIDLTEGLHHPDDPNWAKLHRSIARTLNRPAIAPKAPAGAKSSAKPGSDLPDWARTEAGGSWGKHKKRESGVGLVITLGLALLVAGGPGAFWYFDPLEMGFRATPTASEEEVATAATTIAEKAPPAVAGPNPLAVAISGKWAPSGLTCSDALTIASAGDQLTINYGDSSQTEAIEGAEPDGSLRTRAGGRSYFYSVKDQTLTLRASDGSSTTFSMCGN